MQVTFSRLVHLRSGCSSFHEQHTDASKVMLEQIIAAPISPPHHQRRRRFRRHACHPLRGAISLSGGGGSKRAAELFRVRSELMHLQPSFGFKL
jgi:hypothetical protein